MAVGVCICRDKIRRLALRVIAYFVLEPALLSGRWRIRLGVLGELSEVGARQRLIYREVEDFFCHVDLCKRCGADCCTGAFDRFSVYDRIGHMVLGLGSEYGWGYRLKPFGSYAFNRRDEGWCRGFVTGKGCRYPYEARPSVCVWWVCARMRAGFGDKEVRFLARVRREMDEVHWAYAMKLLFGGLERVERDVRLGAS